MVENMEEQSEETTDIAKQRERDASFSSTMA